MKKSPFLSLSKKPLSKSIISSSSSSSDSDSSSSSSSDKSNPKKSKGQGLISSKSKTPPRGSSKCNPNLNKTDEPMAVTTITQNGTNKHDEHVAILDKLSSTLKEDVQRGLSLLNTCVNQLAQAKWILVNVEKTIDDSYKDCPVCTIYGEDSTTKNKPSSTTVNDLGNEKAKHPTSEEIQSEKVDNGEGSDIETLFQSVQPMGRSGLKFPKISSKAVPGPKPGPKSKKKLPSKEFSKAKTPEKDSSKKETKIVSTGSKTSLTLDDESNAKPPIKGTHSEVQDTKRKPGPRSKTRPRDTPLGKVSEVKKVVSLPFANTDAQRKILQELIKSSKSLHVGLHDIGRRLGGEHHVKDCRIFREIKQEPVKERKQSQTSIKVEHGSSSKGVHSSKSSSKLKRKAEDTNDKSSKRHKSSHSTSNSRDQHKQSSSRHGASTPKDKNSSKSKESGKKDKERDKDKDKIRKSVDSHSSTKSGKSSDPHAKHSKSGQNPKNKSDSKEVKKTKSVCSDSDSKSTCVFNENDENKKVEDVPKDSSKPVSKGKDEIISRPESTQKECIASKAEDDVKPPPPPPPAKKAMTAIEKKMLVNMLQERFKKFQENKLKAEGNPSSAQPITKNESPAVPQVQTVPQVDIETMIPAKSQEPQISTVPSSSAPVPSSSELPPIPESEKEEANPSAASTCSQNGSEIKVTTTTEENAEVVNLDPVKSMETEEVVVESNDITSTHEVEKMDDLLGASPVKSTFSNQPEEAIEIKTTTFDELLSMLNQQD